MTAPFTTELELRNRNNNKDAVIRDDYWYLLGKTPPRLLTRSLQGDDPQWNAFGTCTTTTNPDGTTSNSCTYVSLQQRIAAHNKYGFAIRYGAQEYQRLGMLLQQLQASKNNNNNDALWQQARDMVVVTPQSVPPAIVDAELKMILFATAMITSPNFPGPSKELLVARFYVNECRAAHQVLASALAQRQIDRALAAYDFGRDSWNSYFQIVNRSMAPKVGDKFVAIV
jgi:hypothetical protein